MLTKAARMRRKKMMQFATPERNAWLSGFAAALATMNRLHDQPTAIESTLSDEKITGFMIEISGAERDDLRELRKAYAHLAPSEQRRRWHGAK